jgi:hypothetical protein
MGLLLTMVCRASAINISLIYPSNNLFSTQHDPLAKAAINAAAADLSAAITTNLTAINADKFKGTNGAAEVEFDWSFVYDNPVNGTPTTIDNATISANTVRIYVGAKTIFGDTLGVGGPASTEFILNGTYSIANPSQWPTAVDNAEALSEAAHRRGAGPILYTLEGSSTAAGFTGSYSVDVGITYGALSLDWDGNDNGAKDNNSQLEEYWHFNHTTPVSDGKYDLYSVALHEMMHVLGIGTTDSWYEKISGANWTGANVTALNGNGTGLVNEHQDHIEYDVMSTRITDGTAQEAAMTPAIADGSRKSLTALDLAFLRDIGYTTITPTPVFNPADFNEDGDVDSADLLIWQNAYGVSPNGDTDNDGDSDGRDFLFWQRAYTGPVTLTTIVVLPEPSSILLLASVLLLSGRRIR